MLLCLRPSAEGGQLRGSSRSHQEERVISNAGEDNKAENLFMVTLGILQNLAYNSQPQSGPRHDLGQPLVFIKETATQVSSKDSVTALTGSPNACLVP